MFVKEKLAQLSMCYSITCMQLSGKKYCLCASEERGGRIVAIDTATKECTVLKGLPGGVMAMIPVPEKPNTFLAITDFYPVFDSAGARIMRCTVPETFAGEADMEVAEVATVPFVHRIALAGREGSRRLIVSTLCRTKAFIDDWSHPGSVYAYELDEDLQVTKTRTLIPEISKNHGMFTYEKRGGSYLLVAGEGGVWCIDEKDHVGKLFPGDVSDLCMYDVDGYVRDEIICIAPFHGDRLQVWKAGADGRWSCLAESPITFGHAVWCGDCGGETVIICCSRGGDKMTQLLRLVRDKEDEAQYVLEAAELDAGVGASNIFVEQTENGICLYASNHAAGEVARYNILL